MMIQSALTIGYDSSSTHVHHNNEAAAEAAAITSAHLSSRLSRACKSYKQGEACAYSLLPLFPSLLSLPYCFFSPSHLTTTTGVRRPPVLFLSGRAALPVVFISTSSDNRLQTLRTQV